MTAALAQWAVVALIVVVCVAYALKVLLPSAWRRAIAARLRAAGFESAAEGIDGAQSGCAACARNPTRPGSGAG